MNDINGVWFDGTFYYKNLGNQIKLSWQQFNHNLETIKDVSEDMDGQLDAAIQSAGSALASQQAAALSASVALNAKAASEAAKDLSEAANTSAQAAKNTAVSAKDTAVSANQSAQGAKTAAELARNDSVAARNIAQTSATTATNAKNSAETARNTATQKATEASSSATAAAQSAAEAKESASAVTSVQGKQGVVSLERADFLWMGDAAEKNASSFMKSAGRQNLTVSGVTWPNAVANDPNNWITNSLFQWQTNNNSVTLIGDSATNARRFGIQVGHASPEYAAATGRLDLNPLGGGVYINGSEAHNKGNLPQATQAELNAGTQTAPRIYAPKTFYDAAAFTAHNIANPLNLNNGNNFTISITANSTLANPTGAKSGQTGTLYINHDEGLTLSFGAAWKFIGGVPELPNTAGDAVITYQVVDAANIIATFGEIE